MSATPMSGWLVRSSVLSKILELFHKYFEFICGTCMYDMCYIFSTSLCLSVYVFPACNLNTATMCLTVSRAPFHNSSLVESYLYGSNVKGLLSSCSSGLHSVANDRISWSQSLPLSADDAYIAWRGLYPIDFTPPLHY